MSTARTGSDKDPKEQLEETLQDFINKILPEELDARVMSLVAEASTQPPNDPISWLGGVTAALHFLFKAQQNTSEHPQSQPRDLMTLSELAPLKMEAGRTSDATPHGAKPRPSLTDTHRVTNAMYVSQPTVHRQLHYDSEERSEYRQATRRPEPAEYRSSLDRDLRSSERHRSYSPDARRPMHLSDVRRNSPDRRGRPPARHRSPEHREYSPHSRSRSPEYRDYSPYSWHRSPDRDSRRRSPDRDRRHSTFGGRSNSPYADFRRLTSDGHDNYNYWSSSYDRDSDHWDYRPRADLNKRCYSPRRASPDRSVRYGPSERDFDKIARHIQRFDPKPGGDNDTTAYLRDIDFYLKRLPDVTTEDKIYLIKLTSTREVSRFIERQPAYVRGDYNLLCEFLKDEYPDSINAAGLTSALNVKQDRRENPQAFYHRLRQAFFGPQNYIGMEEDKNFKALFLQNLHPTTSHFLGVSACPLTQTCRQLKELADRAFAKQQASLSKSQNAKDVLTVNLPLHLESASKPNASRENTGKITKIPNQVNGWGRNQKSRQLDSGQNFWQGNRRGNKPYQTRSSHRSKNNNYRGQGQQGQQSQPSWTVNETSSNPSGEITGTLENNLIDPDYLATLNEQDRETIQNILRKSQKTKKADLSNLASLNSAEDGETVNLPTSLTKEPCLDCGEPSALQASTSPQETHQDSLSTPQEGGLNPSNAVLVVQTSPTTNMHNGHLSVIKHDPPFRQLLGNLFPKGTARKLYLSVTLEDALTHDALLDTAADLSIISADLFRSLRQRARRAHRDLKSRPCFIKVQPYSTKQTTLSKMALIQFTVGPMKLVHPVYVSPLNSIPLLVGQDLLNRFEPLIDFQLLQIWAQTCRPLPTTLPEAQDSGPARQCLVLETKIAGEPATASSNLDTPEPSSSEPPNLRDTSLHSGRSLSKHQTPLALDDTTSEATPVSEAALVPQTDRSAIDLQTSDNIQEITPLTWGPGQEPAIQALEENFRSAPCLARPDITKPFHLEIGFTEYSLDAGLYQIHDSHKRVVAYACKCLSAPELQYSDCEKALLTTVWAVKHFTNYMGGQKVIVDTNHQPVAFLTSQRIRDGAITNDQVTAWLATLQSFDIEVRNNQNHKSDLGIKPAACQKCSHDTLPPASRQEEPVTQVPNRHLYFNYDCTHTTTAYVNGCSSNHGTLVCAGAGVVWLNDDPYEQKRFQLGARTSQYAEIAAVLITLQLAAARNTKVLTICTDADYTWRSFTCHLPLWKKNNFLTPIKKPVQHRDLFQACDRLVENNDITVYWKYVRNHSRATETDMVLNDVAATLAKQGTLNGDVWELTPENSGCEPLPTQPTLSLSRGALARTEPTSIGPRPLSLPLNPPIPYPDVASLQASDPALKRLILFLSDPRARQIPATALSNVTHLRHLWLLRDHLQMRHGLLVYVSETHTSPRFVVPQSLRGVMLMHAHDAPTGHRDVQATNQALQQVAYWPHMQNDVTQYIKGCLVCCQFKPTKPLHRNPLQKRDISFPWSDLQLDWVGPLTKSSRGNKYILTITCAFTKWVEGLPAPNNTAQTTAYLLINHVFSKFGLPCKIDSDQGNHFTAKVMKTLWQMLGVRDPFHIDRHLMTSRQVKHANQTVLDILEKYATSNPKDWDIKLPFILTTIRATPRRATGVSPFELMAGRPMTTPLPLFCQPGEANIATAYTAHQYMSDLQEHLKNRCNNSDTYWTITDIDLSRLKQD